jgi:hypothetical protein
MADARLYKNHQSIVTKQPVDTERTPLDGRIVSLDVGGRLFKAYASTLRACPDGMLARMIDGAFDEPKTRGGRLFVDRDPQYFAHILAYLRCVAGGGTATLSLPSDVDVLKGIAGEADYFGLSSLANDIRARLAAQKRAAQLAISTPPSPTPDCASVRIFVAHGRKRATVSAQEAREWASRCGRSLETKWLAFREHDGRCNHDYKIRGDWEVYRSSSGPSCAIQTKSGVVEVASCPDCSTIDPAGLVEAVIDSTAKIGYALRSTKQFPNNAGADAAQGLVVHLVLERGHGGAALVPQATSSRYPWP